MKNIKKRTDNRWEGRKTINGKRISVYAKTQKQCYNLLKKIKSTPITNEIKSYTLFNYSNYWLDTFKKSNIVAESYKNYKNIINVHLKNQNILLKDITTKYIQQIINNLPPTRIKEYFTLTIKQILKKAKEENLIKEDISQYLQKGKIERTQIEWFNLKEQELILNNFNKLTNKLDKLRILTFLLTGCRPNEINTIDKLKINNGFLFVNGTKTKNAKRWIKISNCFEIELQNLETETFLKCDIHSFSKRFKVYLNLLNLSGTVYKLRHTYSTNLYYLGVPDKERQVYMGHFSTVLTNDIYTSFDPTVKKSDIIKLYNNLYPDF